MASYNTFGLNNACKTGDSLRALEIMEKNVANYDELDENGSTCLMWALCNKMHTVCNHILEKGKGHVEKVNIYGRTALMYAYMYPCDTSIIDKLLEDENVLCSNFCKTISDSGKTALYYALENKMYTYVPKLLAKGDCSLNQQTFNGNNALILACSLRNEEVALQIFEACLKTTDFNFEQANTNNETAFLLACKFRLINLANKMLASNKLLNLKMVDKSIKTALLYTLYNNMTDTSMKILQSTEDCNICHNINGNTALLLTCLRMPEDLVLQMLQSSKITSQNINHKDQYGKTPFAYACIHRNLKIATIIFDKYDSSTWQRLLLTSCKLGFPQIALHIADKYLELLESNADEVTLIKAKIIFNDRDQEGFDCIHYATNSNFYPTNDLAMFADLHAKLDKITELFENVIYHDF